jgi:GxxExxY protein
MGIVLLISNLSDANMIDIIENCPKIHFMSSSNFVRRSDLIYPELSYLIVGCAFEVWNELGPGHSERTYQQAMAVTLRKKNLQFSEQVYSKLKFQEQKLNGKFFDFIIENKIVVELKKGDYFSIKHIQQTSDYLIRSKLQLAIIINFTFNGVRSKRIVNIL